MSATDELRRLLDDRGVKWKPIDGEHICFTEWYTHSGAFVYTARESFRSYGDHMLRVETCGLPKACLIATPEQAVAATLGGGSLTADDVLNAVYTHGARWQAIADELNAALGSEPPYDKLLRCLENDWNISAHWDGLRRVWFTESAAAELDYVEDNSRWYELFGTPERAARTLEELELDQLNWCRGTDYCEKCPYEFDRYGCYPPDGFSLLEWLKTGGE